MPSETRYGDEWPLHASARACRPEPHARNQPTTHCPSGRTHARSPERAATASGAARAVREAPRDRGRADDVACIAMPRFMAFATIIKTYFSHFKLEDVLVCLDS